jgi:voltage-gated potassium channel
MKKIDFGSITIWSTVLLVSVMFAAFILPVLPVNWHRYVFRLVYTLIYFSAVLSLKKRSNYLLGLFGVTFIMQWVSVIINMPVLLSISKGANMVFFLYIVVSLIHQIATARKVSAGVILDSVSGYLLLGLIYSIFIIFIIQYDSTAFSVQKTDVTNPDGTVSVSIPLYFSYVTLATLGYGDILPLKPYTRSLATFITISGQFYIAVIVAILVSKFTVQQNKKKKK